jgi:hypothetical protein
MDKFELKRAEIQAKLEEELAKIDEQEKAHQRKIIRPMSSKFSALIAEELEKFGADNLEAVEAYKFSKADLRKRMRKFLEEEFTGQAGDEGVK